MKLRLLICAVLAGTVVGGVLYLRRSALRDTISPVPQMSVFGPNLSPVAPDSSHDHRSQDRSQASSTRPPLRSSAQPAWNQTNAGPEFTDFSAWVGRYVAASPAGRSVLEAEGVNLARVRLQSLAGLIQSNPKRALELAVPHSIRSALPASVKSLLESQLNDRGDYEVVCVLPVPGREHDAPPIVRSASMQGAHFRVFTYDAGLEYVTREDVPLNGIAVPLSAGIAAPADALMAGVSHLMALDPNPARLLDPAAAVAHASSLSSEPLCLATGRPWSADGTPVAIQFAGQVLTFSALSLAEDWVAATLADAALDTPQTPGNLPTAESSYTEGRKRFLCMRVDFPDYQVDALSTNAALTLMRDLGNFMAEISYYKHIIAPVGQGTDITPLMRMSQNAAAYDSAGLSRLYPEAKDVAATNFGYDISQYDFLFVVTGGRPSYSYAGLGYVGGVGFHLGNGYFDVRTSAHEFGHNLGLHHANWWNTGDKTMIGSGTSDEYGDTFDTMGISGGGIRHFSSYNKNRVNWIPNSDCPMVTNSGIFRLYAQDIASAPVGLRGLRLSRSGGDYWIEFRQLWTGNKALMNGVSIRWAPGATTLIDTKPGSGGGKDDHPLTIGRTFSDLSRNYHFTPLGKAHTDPESMDVAVFIGPFPTNRIPEVVVTASSTNVSPGQIVTFNAKAVDPNGDQLAYAWDFGDGDYSVDNSSVTTHSFGSAGDYFVECVVSDLRGGVARHAVLVQVGTPGTFTISGRILGTNNLPMPGVKVSVDSSHYAFTQSDGTYTLARLSAGSHLVTAVEPVSGAFSFVNPFFNNPVVVGPDFFGADFIALSGSQEMYTPFLNRGATWRYLDNGTDQGTAWIAPTFNDSTWSNGPAILGYGEGNENTVLSFGTNASAKHITYYFRQTCVVTNPASFTNLQLEVLRDDGVVVYFNGAEVFRNNLPAGPLAFGTLALAAIEPDSYLVTNLPASLLQPGANYLAAEVHQATLDSSDLTFDLALRGLSVTNASNLKLVYIASPQDHQTLAVSNDLVISAVARSSSAPVQRVEFFVDGVSVGEDLTSPYSFVVPNPSVGRHRLVVSATFAGGGVVSSAPVDVDVVVPPPPPVSISLVGTGTSWRYLAAATGAPPAWIAPDFDDGTWASGNAQLGYGEGDEATVVPFGGNGNNKWITTYYRKSFVAADPAAITNLSLRLKRDDGAIVYLNGREVVRDYLPTGAVAFATLATDAVPDDGQNFNGFVLNPEDLLVGSNVLAVEIHQSAVTSSDLSFDLALDALIATNRSRGVWLTAPAPNATVHLPGNVQFSAEVVAGGNLGVARVEFFADGLKVGEDTAFPFAALWASPAAGAHELVAVATDSAGGALTSAPVSITVTAPPMGSALVSFGEVWRYLDDGVYPGSTWTARAFDDRTWSLGAAKLGYGGDGEITTISSGTNASRRNITAWFRKTFVVTNVSMFDSLLLRLIRDDGAAVYLNGFELYRDNLPSGLISFNSLASTTLGAPGESAPVEVILSRSALRAGTNQLAVEVHQSAVTSSDAGFDLQLTGLRSTNITDGVFLTAPAAGARFAAPAQVELTAFAASTSAPVARVEYFAGALSLGSVAAQPYRLTWSGAPVGTHTLTARATLADERVITSAPIQIAIGEPSPPIQPVFSTLVAAGSTWKYWDNVLPPAKGWAGTVFDDAGWPVGPARFGWGLDGEITPITEGRTTHYFRRWFTVADPGLLSELLFQIVRDDGAVVYLNGRELFRSNMPAGLVTTNTLASATVNTPDETTYFETSLATSGAGLVAGSNLVAIELHQSSAASSDGGFDLQLLAFGTTESRVYLSTPVQGAAYLATAAVPLEAMALASAGSSVARVEFFVDGARLGEATAAPYRLSWASPTMGAHVLTARLTDSRGVALDSPPVNISVTRELVSSVFVPTDAVWKYLDDGSNQGTNWAQPGYDDTEWAAGPAPLGYGGNNEVTLVRSDRTDGTRIMTTYFRRAFVALPGAVYTNLTFRLLRDDGAVVWLNGREAYRSNMATNTTITYTSPSYGTVSGGDEQNFYTTSLTPTNLVSGTNWLAVEVHQVNNTSSDLGFNLELVGNGYVDEPMAPVLSVTYSEQQVEVSWPVTAGSWILRSAPNLAAPANAWSAVSSPVYQVNQRYVVYIAPNGGSQFYRLGKP